MVPNPATPQSFNRYSYVENRPINYADPSGHFLCEGTECNWVPPTDDYLFNRAYEQALWFYQSNFELPFSGQPTFQRGVSSNHDGVDWSGDFAVIAPYEGTITRAGMDTPAGMWRIENKSTGEIREWSVFDTATEGPNSKLRVVDRSENGLLEPEELLASGEWLDLSPEWSHIQGTVINIDHGHHLQTTYYHTNPSVSAGDSISQGETLGMTVNTGWSSGVHLHYIVKFTYHGRTAIIDPLTVTSE